MIPHLAELGLLLGLFIVGYTMITESPDFFFWLFLMLFFDPGGFFAGYFESNAIGLVNFSDLFFLGMLVAIVAAKSKGGRTLAEDVEMRKMLYYLVFFQLYFAVVYGYLVPLYYGRLDLVFFFQKNRMFFMAVPIMYGVYFFSQRSLGMFFKFLVAFSVVILGLYFITLLTHLHIVPLQTWERYGPGSFQRISMITYGLIDWILPIGIVLMLLRKTIELEIVGRKFIYLSALLMLITYLITFTRREYLAIALSIVLITLIISYVFRVSKVALGKIFVVPVLCGILLLYASFPSDVNHVLSTFENSFSLVLTGKDTRGRTDYRVSGTGDLIYAKQIIGEHLYFGTGYIPYLWSEEIELEAQRDPLATALDASAEVPIYGAFLRLGILGVLVASGIYVLLLKDLFAFLRSLKRNANALLDFNGIDLLTTFLVLYLLVSIFTIKAYTLFGDFYSPSTLPVFGTTVSLFYALKKKFEDSFQFDL